MAALSPEDLKSRITSLKRAPPPKVPVGAVKTSNLFQAENGNFVFPKLKSTGKRQSLIEGDSPVNKENELQSAIANRRALFEKNDTKPQVKPKPKYGRRLSEEEKENREKAHAKDSNANIVSHPTKPTLKPLPTLNSLGPPPRKLPRSASLTAALGKYKDCDLVIAPRAKSVASDAEVNGIDSDQDDELYDDTREGTEEAAMPSHATAASPIPEEELIQDEMYDDVDELAEKVKAELASERNQDQQDSNEPIQDDFYDDLDTFVQPPPTSPRPNAIGMEIPTEDAEEFGEDLYQPVDTLAAESGVEEDIGGEEDYELLPNEPPPLPEQRPSAQQSHDAQALEESKKKEKKDKDKEKREKELQKKKEKDEQKRKKEEEKREREEKKRKEEEKKRREKVDKELKKAHKLKGNDPNVGVGTAMEEFKGTGKQELPCCKGASLCVISQDGCPPGKWLVRSTEGHLGYIPSNIVHFQVLGDGTSDAIDEDLYECVDTFQDREEETSPPPPPMIPRMLQQTDHVEEEDLYDDTMEDEELYDDVG